MSFECLGNDARRYHDPGPMRLRQTRLRQAGGRFDDERRQEKMNDPEELMTDRTRRDSASPRQVSDYGSYLRSLTVSNTMGALATWPPERTDMICAAF